MNPARKIEQAAIEAVESMKNGIRPASAMRRYTIAVLELAHQYPGISRSMKRNFKRKEKKRRRA